MQRQEITTLYITVNTAVCNSGNMP